MTKSKFHSPMAFVEAATSHTSLPEAPEAHPEPPKARPGTRPWEKANPRIKVPFVVRMDEPLHAKLTYVAERLPGTSMHSIALHAITEKLDKLLKEINK